VVHRWPACSRRTRSAGVSVQKLLREQGVRCRRKSLTDSEIAALEEQYEAGLTIQEIAAQQGLAKTTVQDALSRAGIVMRPAARRVEKGK
jgi:DNA-directed RNA polymerase specialized sigma24 family protein